jgi:16S rRNA (cytosine1402-N4)-methyltransferase
MGTSPKDLLPSHTPVMLNEALKFLAPKDGEHFLDCTFGAGGFSKAILDYCQCHVTALDKDPIVIDYADGLTSKYNDRFRFIHTSFSESIDKLRPFQFNGIVMDLGVSSMQLDNGNRGFSFTNDGPLDMRMSNSGITAADFINNASEQEIADVIYKYGEETASRKIAKKIVEERQIEEISTTGRLASIVRSSIGYRKGKIDPATKTFQGIRIYINNELGELEQFLAYINYILSPNGRLVIISFHSLEDRIAKNFFKANSSQVVARSKYAKDLQESEPGKWLKILTKKPLSPSLAEIKSNPRSRSAKLRAAIKVG